MPANSEDGDDARLERRAFLTRGGLVAGGAALGAALTMSPAGAQEATVVDYTYVPVPPTRVYDSRGGLGALKDGVVRTLFTTLHTVDPPPLAITINLTVTLTRQKGWIAAYPGDDTFSGTSSINWFGDFQDLANNAYIGIPPAGDPNEGELNFLCGGLPGAEAQFIVDLIGVTAPIDFSTASVTDAIAPYRTPWTDA